MMSYNDVTIVCSHLYGGKTTVHAQQNHHSFICTSASIHAKNPKYYGESKPHVVSFPYPFSMPVTLSPRYFSVPLYHSLIY